MTQYDFWAEKARENTKVRPYQAPAYQAPGSKPWWSDEQPRQPEPQPRPQARIPGQFTQEEQEIIDASTAHATMVRGSGNCPGCGGTNYTSLGKVPGPNGLFDNMRCFDCDYPLKHDVPPDFTSVTGRKMARQHETGGGVVNNYHPQVVTGRLG